MRELGHIDGVGSIGGAEVTYSIRVAYDGNLIHGQGALMGPDRAILAAHEAGRSVLTLQSGESIKVMVTSFSRGGPSPFRTMGPLPGGWAEMIGE